MESWQENIQSIIEIIDQSINSGMDDTLTVETISQKLGYSYFYTSRKFTEISGLQLKDYLRFRKLSLSLMELQDSEKNILEIATKYGFSSHEAFTRAFKSAFGVTPSEYKANPVPLVLRSNFSLAMANLWRYVNPNVHKENEEMKKTKWMAAALIAATSLSFFGCSNGSTDDSTALPSTEVTEQPKENEIFIFDLEGIETLATKYVSDTNGERAAGGNGIINALTSIIGFKSDGTEKSILSFAQNLKLRVDTIKPILETYKCNKGGIDDKAKGIYTIYSSPFTPLYEDGKNAPSVGQILYFSTSQLKVIDIFGGDTSYKVDTTDSESHDNPYISFDNYGKAYISVRKGNKSYLSCFNPVTGKRTDFAAPFNANGKEVNYGISPDGKWFLVSGFVDNTEFNSTDQGNAVLYYVPTDNPANAKCLYESKIKGNTSYIGSYVIDTDTFLYNIWEPKLPVNNIPNNGNFIVTVNADGSLSTRRDAVCYGYAYTDWIQQIGADINNLQEADYKKILSIIKSYAQVADEDQIIFSLRKFGDTVYDAGDTWMETKYCGKDSDGKPLTEVEAVKFLINEKEDDGISRIVALCAYSSKYGNVGTAAGDGYAYGALPINSIFYNKATYDNADAQPITCPVDSTFIKSFPASEIYFVGFNAIWLNDRGNTDENAGKGNPAIFMDKQGNYILQTPAALNSYVTYRDYNGRSDRTSKDPWYKKPVQFNDNGVAYILDGEQKVIFYNGSTVSQIVEITEGKIYGYDIDNTNVVYTVKNADETYTSYKKSLNGGNAIKLNAVESLISVTSIK